MRGVNRADRKLFGSETDQEWDQAASEHTRYHLVGESSGNAGARFRGHDRCISAVHGQSGLDTNEFAGRSEAPLVGRVRAFPEYPVERCGEPRSLAMARKIVELPRDPSRAGTVPRQSGGYGDAPPGRERVR
jgi:hypothetical protein